MNGLAELIQFVSENRGAKFQVSVTYTKVVDGQVVSTQTNGPVERVITTTTPKGFFWDGPVIGAEPGPRTIGFMPYDGESYGVLWKWAVTPSGFTVSMYHGETADKTGRWILTVEFRAVETSKADTEQRAVTA